MKINNLFQLQALRPGLLASLASILWIQGATSLRAQDPELTVGIVQYNQSIVQIQDTFPFSRTYTFILTSPANLPVVSTPVSFLVQPTSASSIPVGVSPATAVSYVSVLPIAPFTGPLQNRIVTVTVTIPSSAVAGTYGYKIFAVHNPLDLLDWGSGIRATNNGHSINANVTAAALPKTPPAVAIISPVNGTTIEVTSLPATIGFNFTATAPGPNRSAIDSVTYELDGSAAPITLTSLTGLLTFDVAGAGTMVVSTAGQHRVTATAHNDGGNSVTAENVFTIVVNGSPPDLVITEPSAPIYFYDVATNSSVYVPVSFMATTPVGTTLSTWSATLARPDTTTNPVAISPLLPSGTSTTGTTPFNLTLPGPYTLTVTATNNYGVSVTKSRSFTVQILKATPVLAWPAPVTIAYGTLISGTQLNAVATVNGLGVAGSYTYTTAGGAPLNAGTLLSAGLHTLNVTFTPTNTAHYNDVTGSITLQVLKAPLSVRAEDKSKVYGDVNPALTYSVLGFVHGETLATSGVTGNPELVTVDEQTGVGSNHAITITEGTLAATNYEFGFVNGKLNIAPATLTVTAAAAMMVYGDALPAFGHGVAGYKYNDSSLNAYTGSPALTTVATSASVPGNYAITVAMGGLLSTNYNFTFVNNTLTINKALLTFKALDATRTYGAANPSFAFSVAGFKNGDSQSNAYSGTPSFSTTATASSAINVIYPIIIGAGSGPTALTSAKYNFEFVPGKLTLTPATLTVRADNKTKTVDAPLPAFTASITGFVASDLPAVVSGGPSLTTTATASSPVGTYPIVAAAGSLATANYVFTFVNGTLQVEASTPSKFEVAGVVFFDLNANGVRNTGEIGLPGINVKLYRNNQVVGSTTTALGGTYSFMADPGSYVVDTIEPPGLVRTDASDRIVIVTNAAVTVPDIGLFLDFCAIASLNAEGKSQGFWKTNLAKTVSGKTNGIQISAAKLQEYTTQLSAFALPPFGGLTMSGAVSIFDAKDQLTLQLLASEYNYANGAFIGGSETLTFALVYWGENILTNRSSFSSAYQEFAKNWFDAYNNSYGGKVDGPCDQSVSKPTICITSPDNCEEFSFSSGSGSNVPFAFTTKASAGYTVTAVSATLNGAAVSGLSTIGLGASQAVTSGTLPSVPAGTHTLKVTGVSGGVTVTDTITFTVKSGGKLPTVVINKPESSSTIFTRVENGPAVSIPFLFTGTSFSTGIKSISATLDGAALAVTPNNLGALVATGAGTMQVLAAGDHTLSVTVTNDHGKATASRKFEVLVIKPALALNITTPKNEQLITRVAGSPATTVPFSFTAQATHGLVSTISATLNGASVAVVPSGLNSAAATGTGTLKVSQDGTYVLKVDGKTAAGLTATAKVTFVVKETQAAPQPCSIKVEWISPADSETVADNRTMEIKFRVKHCCSLAAHGNGSNNDDDDDDGKGSSSNSSSGDDDDDDGSSSKSSSKSSSDDDDDDDNGSSGSSDDDDNGNSGSNDDDDDDGGSGGNSGDVKCTYVADQSIIVSVYEVISNGKASGLKSYTFKSGSSDSTHYTIDTKGDYTLNFKTDSGKHSYQIDVDSFTAGSNKPVLIGSRVFQAK